MNQLSSLVLVSMVCALAACQGNTYRVNAGPMLAVTNGEVALQNAAGSLSLGQNQNDVDSELGLGDTQVAPYVRGEINNERHRFRVHAFGIEADGSGVLLGDYGNLAAGSQVNTSMSFYAVAGNWGYELLREEHYRVAVGAQLGFYSLDIAARSTVGREEVVTNVLVPMPFVEVEGFVGPITVGANAGIMGADLGDGSGRYWDLEGYVRYQPVKNFDLLGGYRYLLLDAYGTASSRDFDADVDMQGVFITAGIKF